MLILSKDADVIFYLVLFCFVFFILSSIPCGGTWICLLFHICDQTSDSFFR